MKRTLSLTLVLGLITASALAATNVVSQNTVGYTTLSATNFTVTGNLAIMGSPFVRVASSTDQTLSSIMGVDHGFVPYGDSVQTFTAGAGYSTYFWDGNQWIDGFFAPADPTIPAGTGFWVIAPRTNEYVVQGEVPEGNVTVNVLASALTLCSNPFPWDIDVQTEMVSGAPTAYVSYLSMYDGTGYQTFLWDGGQWVDGAFLPATIVLQPGQGIWMNHPTAQTVTFLNNVVN